MTPATKDLAGSLLLFLAFAVGLLLVMDTTDIRASAPQDDGCVFWSHTDNRFGVTGVETVTSEGLDRPGRQPVTRVA